MNYINTKSVKQLAKQFGKDIHERDLNVSLEFVSQVDQLVEAIVKEQVLKQENLSKTLRATSWAEVNLSEASRKQPEVSCG